MTFAARVIRPENQDVLFVMVAAASGDNRGFSVPGAYGSVTPSPLYVPGGTLVSFYYNPSGFLGPAIYVECSSAPPAGITKVDVYYDGSFQYTLDRFAFPGSTTFFIEGFSIINFFDTGIARAAQLIFY